jgi:hypothetical protein
MFQHIRGPNAPLRQNQTTNCHLRCCVLSRLRILRLQEDSLVNVHFSSILRLPSLRTLSAASLGLSDRAWTVNAGVSGLHHLELVRCGLDKDDILPML